MKKQRKGIDFISQLPDELLIRILSRLSDADATRSGILSHRWKHLWAFLPNLRFVMPYFQLEKYHDSVDQTLAIRGGMTIQKFSLQCCYGCNANRVNNWLRNANQCQVKELELRCLPGFTFNVCFNFDLFKTSSNWLSKLTLEGCVMLAMPEAERLFPCLKKINLQCIDPLDRNSLENLISMCPVLEELCLDTICELLIDAPKLEYFFVNSYIMYTFKKPVSLVEAHIGNRFGSDELLRCVSNVKILTLTYPAVRHIQIHQIHRINLPMFLNLVKLEIACDENLLLVLLNKMPNLEYLTISDGIYPFGRNWVPSEDTSTCLRFKMKEIIIVDSVRWVDVAIIKYMLKHANVLEKLTMGEVDHEWCKELMSSPRGSNSCRIEFI